MSVTPLHAMLRDMTHWEGTSAGLQQTPGGELTLVRLPAVLDKSFDLPGPWDVTASGLAAAETGLVCFSDTNGDQVLCFDPLCNTQTRITGSGFLRPRGLLIVGNHLYVADSGNARVQVFKLLTLELRAVWNGPFSEPTDLAVDGEGRIYLLDAGLRSVLRLSTTGDIDETYTQAMANYAELTTPAFLAIDDQDILYVSDRTANRVFSFDPNGDFLGVLEGLDAAKPRALAAGGGRLSVADAASGELRAYDLGAGLDLGALPGFRGPVTALLVDSQGGLRIKTDMGMNLVSLAPDIGCVANGHLITGHLDAGMAQTWERVVVSASQPAGTQVRLELHLAQTADVPPGTDDWLSAGSLDTLVPPPNDGSTNAAPARFLWLRVRLSSRDRHTSPTLSQIDATTTARSYIDDLPAVYAREDQQGGFLRRWLALFRAELGDTETLLDDMAGRFDPMTTPADHLQWLAGWLAFELPDKQSPEWSIDWLRELIQEAHDIHTRRGTKAGLQEAVERQTGIRVQIAEAYRERRIWQLGTHSRLGFDTGLAPARPDGAVVPDSREALVVGEFVVDQSGPQESGDFAESLFAEEAHLFSVTLPAGICVGEAERLQLRAIIDAEKPAHTDYQLCFVEPSLRVGFQARIGMDTIVAGPKEPLVLDISRLGLDSRVADSYGEATVRVGYRSNIGQTTRLG